MLEQPEPEQRPFADGKRAERRLERARRFVRDEPAACSPRCRAPRKRSSAGLTSIAACAATIDTGAWYNRAGAAPSARASSSNTKGWSRRITGVRCNYQADRRKPRLVAATHHAYFAAM